MDKKSPRKGAGGGTAALHADTPFVSTRYATRK